MSWWMTSMMMHESASELAAERQRHSRSRLPIGRLQDSRSAWYKSAGAYYLLRSWTRLCLGRAPKDQKICRCGGMTRLGPTRHRARERTKRERAKGKQKEEKGKESSFMRPSTRRVTTNKSIVVDSRYVGGSACCCCQAVGHRLGLLPRVGVGNRNEATRERIRHPWSLSL